MRPLSRDGGFVAIACAVCGHGVGMLEEAGNSNNSPFIKVYP